MRFLVEAERGRELARRPDRRRRPSGPCAHGWRAGRQGRSGATRGRGGGKRAPRRAGRRRPSSVAAPAAGRRGIGWPERTASKRRAPMLGGGLEQRLDEDVERPEADAQPVKRLAVGLLEVGDRRRASALRGKHAAGVGEHRRERADAGRAGRIGGGRGELLERAQDGGRSARRASASSRARSAARLCADSRSSARAVRKRRLEQRAARRRGGRGHARPRRRRARRRPRRSAANACRRAPRPAPARGGRARRRGGARPRQAAGACRRAAPTGRRGTRSRSRWPIGSGPTLTSPSAATVTGKRVGAARADVAHQHRRAAVDEALGQPLVERIADSRASTSRVRSAHFAGSASQSARWAI